MFVKVKDSQLKYVYSCVMLKGVCAIVKLKDVSAFSRNDTFIHIPMCVSRPDPSGVPLKTIHL